MDGKAVITILLIVLASLGLTAWLGYSNLAENPKSEPSKGYADDTGAPELDEDDQRPKAVADELVHNFGSMELGDKGSYTFSIKNEGEDVLKISKGASTCKCTVSDLPSNEIPPGETAEVVLEWEPKSKSRNFSQKAKIWTNDPENRSLDFGVQGLVDDKLNRVPEGDLTAGSLQEGIGASTRLRIFSRLVDEIPEPEIIYDGETLIFEVKPLEDVDLEELDTKNGYAIFVNVAPTAPVGSNRELFSFKTKVGDEVIEEQVTVTYSRLGPIRIMPLPNTVFFEKTGLVDFKRFDAKDGKIQEVTLLIDNPPEDAKVEVTLSENELEEMKVTVEPKTDLKLKGKQAFRIVLEIPPGIPPMNHARSAAPKIVFKTTHPEVSEVILHAEVHSK
ncbi:MAG: DUF1573 domain-containing protein [Planctomycetaceae bacterium]|jgi:hypothetical protein|nr:DUF1573 domain-containing protein [bacterium]MDG2391120.1 DUF1573 domain-containing protein [Planctomycetaceae bacterium]